MEKETHHYTITFQGKSLEDFRAGKISIIDILSERLGIPQKNIECKGSNPTMVQLLDLKPAQFKLSLCDWAWICVNCGEAVYPKNINEHILKCGKIK